MLIYSMSVSADGFINDLQGGMDWTAPGEELFALHLDRVRSLGGYILGRKLYETMLVWEIDPAMRQTPLFADVWTSLPKVIFSRTLTSVSGNARLANASLSDEIETMQAGTDRPIEIGGAGLAAQALELGKIDDLRLLRFPVIVGGGTPFFPTLNEQVPLQLVEVKPFASGVVYEHFDVVKLPL